MGDAWKGSSARSMRDALESLQAAAVTDVIQVIFFHPIALPSCVERIACYVRCNVRSWSTGFIGFSERCRRRLRCIQGVGYQQAAGPADKGRGSVTVNVFPDHSPHAYGRALREAIGEYDLVVSTKPFHPGGWQHVYGYRNTCVCVPHGYDPAMHYWPTAPSGHYWTSSSPPPGVPNITGSCSTSQRKCATGHGR